MEKLNKLGGDETTDPLQEAGVQSEVCHLLPAAMTGRSDTALQGRLVCIRLELLEFLGHAGLTGCPSSSLGCTQPCVPACC